MYSYAKKSFIYIMCTCLVFSCVSNTFIKSKNSYAFEYVGGALAFEEALKWLLAVMGITTATGFTADYWDKYGDDFVDYATENGATQTEVAEWQLKLCEGILDKTSSVWDSFKTWASSLVSSGSGSVSGGSFSDFINYISSGLGVSNTINSVNSSYTPVAACLYIFGSNVIYINFWCSSGSYTFNNYTLCNGVSSSLKMVEAHRYVDGSDSGWTFNSDRVVSNYTSWSSGNSFNFFNKSCKQVFINYGSVVNAPSGSDFIITDLNGDVVVGDENFNSLDNVDVNNLDVISSSALGTDDKEVAIPLPGLSDSDNTVSNDTYEQLLDLYNDGLIDYDELIQRIQDLVDVIVYDTDTDEVIPVILDDDGKPENKDDKIQENKNNMEFTLSGLEQVFPFCIPWDLYAFMSLLKSDPVAPVFKVPLLVSTSKIEYVEIDLSPWQKARDLMALVLDFLFIFGLAMITRKLIGVGGGSDD